MPIQIAGKFVPQNDNTWPLLEDKFIQGGYRIVANEAERLAMNVEGLKIGQKIYQVDTDAEYRITAVTLEDFTSVLIPAGEGGSVDPLLIPPAYMGTVTSRYDASIHSHSKSYVVSSAKIQGFNLPFTRSGTDLTVSQENHGRSVGDRAILRVVSGGQIIGVVNAMDAAGFTLTVPDSGPTSGYASYSLGVSWFWYKNDYVTAATGVSDIRGGRGLIPAGGEIVVHSMRLRMPANSRDGTLFNYEFTGDIQNGFMGGTQMDNQLLPYIGCRSEGSGVGAGMTAVGITQIVNADGVWHRHQSANMPNVAAATQVVMIW